MLLQVESFWLSDTLPVPAVAASSKAGSTCASAGHSRTSSIQGLPGAASHASHEALMGLDTAAAEDAGAGVSAGGVLQAFGGSSVSGSSYADSFAANLDAAQEGRCLTAFNMRGKEQQSTPLQCVDVTLQLSHTGQGATLSGYYFQLCF